MGKEEKRSHYGMKRRWQCSLGRKKRGHGVLRTEAGENEKDWGRKTLYSQERKKVWMDVWLWLIIMWRLKLDAWQDRMDVNILMGKIKIKWFGKVKGCEQKWIPSSTCRVRDLTAFKYFCSNNKGCVLLPTSQLFSVHVYQPTESSWQPNEVGSATAFILCEWELRHWS